MKNFGLPELLIILVIVLLIFGAGKLPQIGGAIGKSIREFKKSSQGDDGKKESTAAATPAAPAKEETKN